MKFITVPTRNLPAPPWVGSRSPDGWDQIPYRPGGWVLHQPPWSFGFDSQTRGTRVLVRDGQTSPRRPRLVVSRSTCPPLSPPTHANSFVLGPAVINTHTGGIVEEERRPWRHATEDGGYNSKTNLYGALDAERNERNLRRLFFAAAVDIPDQTLSNLAQPLVRIALKLLDLFRAHRGVV